MATALRWGSAWYTQAVVPYLRSLFLLQPDVQTMAALPLAARLHVIGAFVLFGIDRVDATAAALLYRGLHYATVLAVGTPALVWLEAKQRSPPPIPAAAETRPPARGGEAADSGEGSPRDLLPRGGGLEKPP